VAELPQESFARIRAPFRPPRNSACGSSKSQPRDISTKWSLPSVAADVNRVLSFIHGSPAAQPSPPCLRGRLPSLAAHEVWSVVPVTEKTGERRPRRDWIPTTARRGLSHARASRRSNLGDPPDEQRHCRLNARYFGKGGSWRPSREVSNPPSAESRSPLTPCAPAASPSGLARDSSGRSRTDYTDKLPSASTAHCFGAGAFHAASTTPI